MNIKFLQDQDCHWYAVPENMVNTFKRLDEEGVEDYWVEFCDTFDEYRIDHPSEYLVKITEEQK